MIALGAGAVATGARVAGLAAASLGEVTLGEGGVTVAGGGVCRGMIRELVSRVREELAVPGLPVVATGGYAALVSARLPEITIVVPHLTLEGLRLTWEFRQGRG